MVSIATATWSLDDVAAYRRAVENPFLAFVDSVLRGVGQVMFQNNPITGLLFLVGIFWNSWIFGCYALGVTIVSTLTAMLLGVPKELVRAGLFGFNGTLGGIAMAFFLKPEDPFLILYAIGLGICCTVFMSALLNALGTWEVPALTAPFVLSAWFFLFAFYHFGVVHNTQFIPIPPKLPEIIGGPSTVTAATFVDGFFKGVAEVFFQDNLVTGIIFLIAILVNSRISFLFAAIGSILALLTALALQAPEPMVHLGLYGFSAVLTGIAVGGVFFVIDWKSTLYTLFAIIVTAVLFGTISVALAPISMPALTAPFVVTTWFFIFAKPLFKQLHAVPPAEAGSAEANLRAFLAKQGAAKP